MVIDAVGNVLSRLLTCRACNSERVQVEKPGEFWESGYEPEESCVSSSYSDSLAYRVRV